MLQALVASFNVPADAFGAVCIVVDKLDKLPADKVSCSPCTRPMSQCGTAFLEMCMGMMACNCRDLGLGS